MIIESERLYRRDPKDSKSLIHKLWYDEDQNRHEETVKDFNPYFYVEKEGLKNLGLEDTSNVDVIEDGLRQMENIWKYIKDTEVGYEGLEGEDLVKLTLYNIGRVRTVKEYFEECERGKLVAAYDDFWNMDIEVEKQYHHEADVNFANRYMIDEYEDMKSTNLRTHYMDIEVSDAYGFGDPKTAKKPILSIAFYDDFEEDYLIYTYKDAEKLKEKGILEDAREDGYKIEEDKYTTKIFENEREMIIAYLDYIQETKPQILAGWNISSYDIKYLVNRMEKGKLRPPGIRTEGHGAVDTGKFEKLFYNKENGEKPKNNEPEYNLHVTKLSPLRDKFDSSTEKYIINNRDDSDHVRIKGIEVFDLLKAYRSFRYGEKESYSLDNIAKDEIGAEKIVLDKGFFEMYDEEFPTFLKYNKRDVELTVEINEKLGLVDFWDEAAGICKCSLEEILVSMRQVDNFILNYVNWNYNNLVLPSREEGEKVSFEGGYVEESEPGLTNNVAVMDLRSLYPSIIQSFNLSPEVIDMDGEIEIDREDGMVFSKEPGLLPQIFDQLFDKRNEYKKKRNKANKGSPEEDMYDSRQRSIKVIMNTAYGVLTNPYYRLFEPKVGKAITMLGRETIKWSGDYAQNYQEDFDYIYSDTDSIFVSYNPDQTDLLDLQDFLDDLNDSYDDFAGQYGMDSRGELFMEFEKVYSSMFMTQAKKRYASRKVYDEGHSLFVELEDGSTRLLDESKDWVGVGDKIDGQEVVRCGEVEQKKLKEAELDVTGFELVRSDYPKFAQDLQRDVLWKIVCGEDKDSIMQMIKERRKKLMDGEYSLEEVGVPSGINKDLGTYDSETQHVRGAKYSNKYLGLNITGGDKVKMLYVSRLDGYKNTDVICFKEPEDVPDELYVDWDKMEKKLVQQPLDRIFKGMDWRHNEYRGQKTLEDII